MTARFINKRKKEIGISPYELVFRGEQKVDSVSMHLIDYYANNLEEKEIGSIEDAIRFQETNSVTWLNVYGLHNPQIMEEIAKGFKLDNLVLANVMDTFGRPKVQDYDKCVFISLKMVKQEALSDTFIVDNFSLILMGSVLITFQEKKEDVFEPVRGRIRKHRKRICNSGIDYLVFTFLDVVIDNYIYAIDRLGEKIETLEESVLGDPQKDVVDSLNVYKQELNFLRKNIKPAREMIISLSKMESEFIDDSTEIHLKELVNNINQATDSLDSYREILSDQLNVYHTIISGKLNDIMKFLTIFSVIFIPLTFIAGIYGTNFDVLPELHFQYGYFMMLGTMVVLTVGMLFYFRRKQWF